MVSYNQNLPRGFEAHPLRYLAITLGRPISIQEHDLTVAISMEIDPAIRSRLGNLEEKLWVGVVAHFRYVHQLVPRCVLRKLIPNEIDLL